MESKNKEIFKNNVKRCTNVLQLWNPFRRPTLLHQDFSQRKELLAQIRRWGLTVNYTQNQARFRKHGQQIMSKKPVLRLSVSHLLLLRYISNETISELPKHAFCLWSFPKQTENALELHTCLSLT